MREARFSADVAGFSYKMPVSQSPEQCLCPQSHRYVSVVYGMNGTHFDMFSRLIKTRFNTMQNPPVALPLLGAPSPVSRRRRNAQDSLPPISHSVTDRHADRGQLVLVEP